MTHDRNSSIVCQTVFWFSNATQDVCHLILCIVSFSNAKCKCNYCIQLMAGKLNGIKTIGFSLLFSLFTYFYIYIHFFFFLLRQLVNAIYKFITLTLIKHFSRFKHCNVHDTLYGTNHNNNQANFT